MSNEGADQKRAVCTCNTCSGHLEFDASEAGSTITCPHCGLDTVLFLPGRASATAKASVAEIVEQTEPGEPVAEGRLELEGVLSWDGRSAKKVIAELETVGDILLVVGLLSALLGIVSFFANETFTWPVLGTASFVASVFIRTLFKAAAEAIRLLDSLNKHNKFTGKWVEFETHAKYRCSLCNASVTPEQARCSRCGAELRRTSRVGI